jgi:hypothetical protein
MKEGCLFVCHIELSQTIIPFVAFLVSLESPWWMVHQIGFRMFWPIIENLLIFKNKTLKIYLNK